VRAGVKVLRFHDLRHFYASLLINHGESVKVVQARRLQSHVAGALDALRLGVLPRMSLTGQDEGVSPAESRAPGFSATVRAERLDGAHLGDGWGIFHRWGTIDGDEGVAYEAWDGYLELTATNADHMWFAPPFRVVPDSPDHGPAIPPMIVRTRHWRPLAGERVGLLVVEDEPTTDP
jgi:hypothetical protein